MNFPKLAAGQRWRVQPKPGGDSQLKTGDFTLVKIAVKSPDTWEVNNATAWLSELYQNKAYINWWIDAEKSWCTYVLTLLCSNAHVEEINDDSA